MWWHKTSVQNWGWKEVKDLQAGRTESRMRYLKGVETHSDPLFQQTLTHILSLDLLTPPHSFCLSCSVSSRTPLTSSLNNYIACMALLVFSPNRISQAGHRLERAHGRVAGARREPLLPKQNLPSLTSSTSTDYSLWHLHSQVASLWLWLFPRRNELSGHKVGLVPTLEARLDLAVLKMCQLLADTLVCHNFIVRRSH